MMRYRVGFLFLLLSLILMSCNLTSLLPFNQEDAESTVEELTEGIMEQLDPSQSEATPEEQPQPAENEPMEEPSDSTSADESMQSSSSSNTGQSTACDHPYFPMRPGASWVYFEEGDSYYHHWDVLSVDGNEQNATAIMTAYIGEFSELTEENKAQMITIEYNWVCSAEDGIVSFDLATLEVPQMEDEGLEMTLTFVDGDGVMLPPANRMNIGDTWDMDLQMEFSMPELMGVEGTMTLNDFYTVVSHDPVDVLGSNFEGIQYEREFDIAMEINMGGTTSSMPTQFVDYKTTTNLAKGVGFVTLDSRGDFGDTGLQLISYNIP